MADTSEKVPHRRRFGFRRAEDGGLSGESGNSVRDFSGILSRQMGEIKVIGGVEVSTASNSGSNSKIQPFLPGASKASPMVRGSL
jgi:hypothetical protein